MITVIWEKSDTEDTIDFIYNNRIEPKSIIGPIEHINTICDRLSMLKINHTVDNDRCEITFPTDPYTSRMSVEGCLQYLGYTIQETSKIHSKTIEVDGHSMTISIKKAKKQ